MKFKQFIKTALIFLVGNMLSKLVSFFLLPLYTSKIDPSQFGNYDVTMSFINLIVPIAFFQIWDGMYRYSFEYKEKQEKEVVISNALACCGFGALIYLMLFPLVQAFFQIDYYIFALIYGIIYALHYVHTYAARTYLSNKLFVWSGVVSTLVTALSNMVLILGFGWDVKSIYISLIMGAVAQILIIEIKIAVIGHFRISVIDKDLIKKMARFSIPLCVATVSYWLLSGLTKIYIQNIAGSYANGLYAVSNKFATLITLFVSVIQFAWNESAYIMTDDSPEKRRENYTTCISVMTLGVVYGTGIVCIAVKLIFPFLIDAQYYAALELVPATIIGVAANALAGFLGTIFMAEKKNGFITISTLVAACINIIAGYVFTKAFGLHGAVVSLGACLILLCAMRIIRLVMIYKLKLNLFSIFTGVIISAICIINFFLVDAIWILLLMALLSVSCLLIALRKYILMIIHSYRGKNAKI